MARRRHTPRRRPWYRTRAYRLTRTVVLTAALATGAVRCTQGDGPADATGTATGRTATAGAKADQGAAAGADADRGAPTGIGEDQGPAAGTGAGRARPSAAGAGRGAPAAASGTRSGAGTAHSGAGTARTAHPRPSPPTPHPLPRSRPTRVLVPYIGVDAPVIGLGLDRDHRLTAPPESDAGHVGWYEGGPSPGEQGTAVLVGHLDTDTGPAVFAGLGELRAGHLVELRRADGRTAVYTIDAVKSYEKSHFPDGEVYGARGRPELRLITCGGEYHRRTGYAGNTVVFAHLTGVR
ncbi:class F sortase [Streptomyces sp. CA-249302]|uniref:class F sortase n=1 Tax=Streptomyces sp. CA-249302 TaxID=3240058 RepID=UPI003D939233